MKYLLIFAFLALIPLCYSASLAGNATSEISEDGLTKDQRRQFSKAHAILMIIGWLFFVPTGFLFARLGRDLYKEQTLFGSAVWFQIHRISNFMGVVCICTSMICIGISQRWHWKGSWSGSNYWTEVHTDLGVISTILAIAQPLNSLLRCGPTHSKRVYFNWAHRIVGIVSYSLAFTAIIIAAVQFKRIWSEPLLEVILVSIPTVMSIGLTVSFTVLESDKFRNKSDFGAEEPLLFDENSKPQGPLRPHILRVPAIFMSIGAFAASALALSLLVVNGYKNV